MTLSREEFMECLARAHGVTVEDLEAHGINPVERPGTEWGWDLSEGATLKLIHLLAVERALSETFGQ